MKTFKDAIGREWVVDVNVATARAVRDILKVDLFSLFEKEAGRLFADPCLTVDVLYVLCRKQCDDRKVTDVEFGSGMSGDALLEGTNALIESVIDFFPSSRRPVLRAMVKKATELQTVMTERALTQIEAVTVENVLTGWKSPSATAG